MQGDKMRLFGELLTTEGKRREGTQSRSEFLSSFKRRWWLRKKYLHCVSDVGTTVGAQKDFLRAIRAKRVPAGD